MARSPIADEKPVDAASEQPVCGIIMPISDIGDYTSEHWRRVQRVITKAVAKAGMIPRLVWENPEVDVIHSRILQNIYESDVVICDVSGLNPNVMLELGLRLSTKRPTVVITDGIVKPPFDLSVYQYHAYARDLEYNSTDQFISEISEKITQVHIAFKESRYKSFVENFTFEVVEPSSVSVSAEEALRERIDLFAQQLSRMEARLTSTPRTITGGLANYRMSFKTTLGSEDIPVVIDEIKNINGVREASFEGKEYDFTITARLIGTPSTSQTAKKAIEAVIEKHDLPF